MRRCGPRAPPHAQLDPAEQSGRGEEVTDDVVLPRVVGEPGRVPALPRGAQEFDEPGVVNSEDRGVAVRPGVDHPRVGVLQLGADGSARAGSSSASIATPIQTADEGAAADGPSLQVTGIESATR